MNSKSLLSKTFASFVMQSNSVFVFNVFVDFILLTFISNACPLGFEFTLPKDQDLDLIFDESALRGVAENMAGKWAAVHNLTSNTNFHFVIS